MGALTTTPDHYVTESEYLQSSFEVDCDLVDGHLEERNVGEIEHSNWQRALMLWFFTQQASMGLIAMPEIRTRIAPGRYRVPDISIFTKSPKGTIVTEPALAIFEVLSPEDRYSRLKARFRDYANFGVPALFAIESRSDISVFKNDQFIPIHAALSPLGSQGVFVDWDAVRSMLLPQGQ